MTTRIAKAMSMPPKPAKSMPKFQPEKSPEMTAATARPQSPQTPAVRVSLRFSNYPESAVVYFTPETLRVSFAMTAPLLSSRGPIRAGAGGCDALAPTIGVPMVARTDLFRGTPRGHASVHPTGHLSEAHSPVM